MGDQEIARKLLVTAAHAKGERRPVTEGLHMTVAVDWDELNSVSTDVYRAYELLADADSDDLAVARALKILGGAQDKIEDILEESEGID